MYGTQQQSSSGKNSIGTSSVPHRHHLEKWRGDSEIGWRKVSSTLQGSRKFVGGLCGLSISYQACGSTSGGLLLQDEEWHMFWWAGTLLLDVKSHWVKSGDLDLV